MSIFCGGGPGTSGTAGRGADAIAHLKDAMRDVHGAFPDIRFTIEDAVESGDTIWVRVRGRGTATGPFFGPPSGRPVDFTVIDVCRVVDGRIVDQTRHWQRELIARGERVGIAGDRCLSVCTTRRATASAPERRSIAGKARDRRSSA